MAPLGDSFELVLHGVPKRFDDVLAVRGIDLAVRPGEFVSLLGPAGCGKTTTLRLIAGFEQPDSGAIRIGGEDVQGLPAYKRNVNTVFQSYALFPHMSVLDNVAYGLRHRGMARAQRGQRAARMLPPRRPRGGAGRAPHAPPRAPRRRQKAQADPALGRAAAARRARSGARHEPEGPPA